MLVTKGIPLALSLLGYHITTHKTFLKKKEDEEAETADVYIEETRLSRVIEFILQILHLGIHWGSIIIAPLVSIWIIVSLLPPSGKALTLLTEGNPTIAWISWFMLPFAGALFLYWGKGLWEKAHDEPHAGKLILSVVCFIIGGIEIILFLPTIIQVLEQYKFLVPMGCMGLLIWMIVKK